MTGRLDGMAMPINGAGSGTGGRKRHSRNAGTPGLHISVFLILTPTMSLSGDLWPGSLSRPALRPNRLSGGRKRIQGWCLFPILFRATLLPSGSRGALLDGHA
jgi:hypothetical protein